MRRDDGGYEGRDGSSRGSSPAVGGAPATIRYRIFDYLFRNILQCSVWLLPRVNIYQVTILFRDEFFALTLGEFGGAAARAWGALCSKKAIVFFDLEIS